MESLVFPKISLNKIKGVLIDIDNTLYSYDFAHQAALKITYGTLIKEKVLLDTSFAEFCEKYRKKRNEVTKRLKAQGACRSRLFAFQALFEEMQIPQAFNRALSYENLYWETLIKNAKLNSGAHQFLKKCHIQNVSICAISDMQAHFQIQKLQKLEIDRLIDYLVTSEEVGEEKPSSIIFETALRKLNLSASEVVMVGDSIEKDIKGAENMGIKAFQVQVMK